MRIEVIGGGPGGLFLSVLLKQAMPDWQVRVHERNRPADTFGFGVVFSDATLDNFEKHDLPSYRRITQEFAYWDDIAVHFRGTVHRVGGNGFCGCSRRKLLLILQERARELVRAARGPPGVVGEVPRRRVELNDEHGRHERGPDAHEAPVEERAIGRPEGRVLAREEPVEDAADEEAAEHEE